MKSQGELLGEIPSLLDAAQYQPAASARPGRPASAMMMMPPMVIDKVTMTGAVMFDHTWWRGIAC